MFLIILGYFLLPSLAEGANKAFTCSPGHLAATCDAGKVILIKLVKRGNYGGAFNDSHCHFHTGDGTELDDGDSKQVWKDCNLQSKCSLSFNASGNLYLEMDYDCVHKNNIDMLDICTKGSGTLLTSTHGYIHSPCYPNLSTWTNSTYVFCQCIGTFRPPPKEEELTVNVFHTFQENDSLEIRWHANDNQPETFKNTSPSFKTKKRTTAIIYLIFSSTYQGSDWDRGFRLEFKANSSLEFNCTNPAVTPLTCQNPITTPTTIPTKTTRTKTATATATTNTTTTPPTKTHTEEVLVGQLSQRDIIAIAVGTILPLIVIAAILAVVLITLRKRRQAAKAKSESKEDLYGNVSKYKDVEIDMNKTQDPGEKKVSNNTDLYSSVDDVDIETPGGGEGEKYSDDELYSSVDDGATETPGGEGEKYSDDERYGPVNDDDVAYDYAYAEGRSYDGVDPDYGEVGDTQHGGLFEPDDDTYDHATLTAKYLAPFESHDDTYDHVALEYARNLKVQE